MSPMSISLIVFACVFGGALLGMSLRAILPDHHLSVDSKSVLTLVIGLIAAMSALVLGLLMPRRLAVDTKKPDLYWRAVRDLNPRPSDP